MSPPPDQAFAEGDSHSDNGTSGVEAHSEISDFNGDVNAAHPKRSAWTRPSNGFFDAGSVMGGAVSWPPLSESTRPLPRSSTDSTQPIHDGSASSSQAPAAIQLSQGQANSNSNPNSVSRHSRQRSRNHSGVIGSNGGGSASGGGPSHNNFGPSLPQASPSFSGVPIQHIQPGRVPSATGTRPVQGVGSSQPHIVNGHPSIRSSSRRDNYGPRPRGEGQFQNNFGGGRHINDRRDVIFIQHYANPTVRFVTPSFPGSAASFVPPPPHAMSFYPQTAVYDMNSSYIHSPTMTPMVIGPPPVSMPASTSNGMPSLTTMILNQIDYYFSYENLVKDYFLRSRMDDNGWVPITLIASFPQVVKLTKEISLILEALRYSTVVEVEGEKMRPREDWSKWAVPSAPSLKPGSDKTLAAASLQ